MHRDHSHPAKSMRFSGSGPERQLRSVVYLVCCICRRRHVPDAPRPDSFHRPDVPCGNPPARPTSHRRYWFQSGRHRPPDTVRGFPKSHPDAPATAIHYSLSEITRAVCPGHGSQQNAHHGNLLLSVCSAGSWYPSHRPVSEYVVAAGCAGVVRYQKRGGMHSWSWLTSAGTAGICLSG